MKLFHISDLHLGKRVYEFSMLEEQRELLAQIIEKIKAEQPAALLITGDIYDKPVPPTEAVRLLNDFLTEVSGLGVKVYLIAGNHDSAQRLEFGKELLAQSGVYFCGSIGRKIEVFQDKDEYGAVNFYLLPFFKPAHVQSLLGQETESYREAAKLLLAQTEIDSTQRNILLAHQFVTWHGAAERSDSESATLGGIEEIDAGLFADFDYVALGHLHSPQRMGMDSVRYAGSPMPYSFSEIRQEKGITVLDLRKKGELELDFIPLETKRKFREIRGNLADLLAAAEGDSEDYIRCILTDQAPLLDPIGQLRAVYPNLMTLEFAAGDAPLQQEIAFDAEEIRPDALFALFFQKQNERELSETQTAILQKIWKELEERE